MYHILFFYHFHCINPILFYCPPILPMLSKHIQQCSNCHQWLPTFRGAYMKHIWHCQLKLTGSSLLDQDCIRSLNPLLSLTTDGHSPNIDYNCNLYVDSTVKMTMVKMKHLLTITVTPVAAKTYLIMTTLMKTICKNHSWA